MPVPVSKPAARVFRLAAGGTSRLGGCQRRGGRWSGTWRGGLRRSLLGYGWRVHTALPGYHATAYHAQDDHPYDQDDHCYDLPSLPF
jgi:hypothetical protein